MTACFDWAGPARVVFGAGELRRLPECVRGWGKRYLLVTGAGRREAPVVDLLAEAGWQGQVERIAGEPEVAEVDAMAQRARASGCDWVIALGGGSALDAGKAVAALLTNPGTALNYLEVVGQGRSLAVPAAPCVAIPTTAGTGSEATRNAVLLCPEQGVKASLRHASMLPRLALVDPELALGLPAALTAATGMDALTQLLEAFVCTRANAMTDALCAQAIPLAVQALPRVAKDGADLTARADMALAALFSGMALANAGLGAVHGFAAPLGGRYGLPHGAVCAALLPAVWEVNLSAVRDRGRVETRQRFQQVAAWLTGNIEATAEDGVSALRDLADRLGLARLQALGVPLEEADTLLPLAQRASSMKANPVPLTERELRACLEKA